MSVQLTNEQIAKVGNTVIYLSNGVSELMRTKLLKLLFLIEEKSIKESGKPFFNLDFKIWQFGPVVEPIYNEMTNQETNIFQDYFRKNQFDEFIAVNGFDDDEFSNNDIALLDKMIDFARHKIAQDFVRITHSKESLWRKSALEHGILEQLESKVLSTTDFSINFLRLFDGDEDSYIFEKYVCFLENSTFSNNFKLRSV